MAEREFVESRGEMEQILGEETVGYLGLSMDGLSYVVPLNYAYVDGQILFHCALTGKKLDYLRANPQVCFTVARQFSQVRQHVEGQICNVDNDSVISYGQARIVEDLEERKGVLDVFSRVLQPDEDETSFEDTMRCYAVEIRISEMTGRQERGGKRAYWRYSFDA